MDVRETPESLPVVQIVVGRSVENIVYARVILPIWRPINWRNRAQRDNLPNRDSIEPIEAFGRGEVWVAGGFIGGHLVNRLKREGFWVRGVDLKFHELSETEADDFVVGDLRDQSVCRAIVDRRFDEVYQLAADRGAFTGEHDAELMHNSATINLNMLDFCHRRDVKKIFLLLLGLHVPGLQPGEPAQPKLLGGFGLSGGAR
jgi:hypothetical protein